jgi:hypothetical protein
MNDEQECERLRAENGLLRAALETVPALVEENARLRADRRVAHETMTRLGREIMPTLEILARTRDDIAAILEASPRPFEAARAAKSRRSQIQTERAIALRDRGLSKPQIGLRMAIEDGRVYPAGEDCAGQVWPYAETTVYRWLRAQKG